ncbi:MAG: sarcosine oxidase subunit gamma [Gemmatimonadales bacterium]
MAEATLACNPVPLAIVNLRVRRSGEEVARWLGIGSLPEANRVVTAGGRQVIWLGPEEFLIVSATDRGPELEGAIKGAGAEAAVDVSAGWTVFDLIGPWSREALAACCWIDLHPRAFSVGQAAQTLIAKAAVILWQPSEAPGYRILARPSFADYVERVLLDAAGG